MLKKNFKWLNVQMFKVQLNQLIAISTAEVFNKVVFSFIKFNAV